MAEERTSNYIKLCDEWAEKFLQMDKEERFSSIFGIVMTNLKHRRIFCSITVRLILIMWRVRYLQLKWGYVVWQNWQDCL